MRKRTKIILVGSVLAVILAFNYWQPRLQKSQESAAELSNADYYFKDVVVKQFDQAGMLQNQLQAEKMEHFRFSDTSNFISPKILFMSQSGDAWQIESKTGLLEHRSSLLKLREETAIYQTQSQSETIDKNIIRTTDLLLDLNQKTATTDGAVSIETEQSITRANGLFAEFGTQKIALKSDVETLGLANDPNQ